MVCFLYSYVNDPNIEAFVRVKPDRRKIKLKVVICNWRLFATSFGTL